MPTFLLMMNSSRARPTPSFGSWRNSNASSGIADVHHDLGRRRRHPVERDVDDLDVEEPGVDMAGVALAHETVTCAPSVEHARRVAAADDRRDAELARDDRRVARAAAAIGDDRRGALHHGLPVGIGHVGDQHVACLHAIHLRRRLDERARCPARSSGRSRGRSRARSDVDFSR